MNGRTILCLVCGLGLSAAVPGAETASTVMTVPLQAQGPRTSGPVSVSLQNEINAAVDRGRGWLVASQNVDGSWGSDTSCVPLTALAALSLAHNASPEEKRAIDKAGQWLLTPEVARAACDNIEGLIWRELALQAITFPHPPRTAAFFQGLQILAATNFISPFSRMLIQEAVPSQIGLLPFPASTDATNATHIIEACLGSMPQGTLTAPSPALRRLLMRLAADWGAGDMPCTSQLASMRQYWVLAHFINRAGSGSLADEQGRLVDWRNDLARKLVATQSIDARKQGNGFWRGERGAADWASHPVAETAFALLALDEL
ncbi:MAG: hypothetical protein WCR06_09715 [bacterium]